MALLTREAILSADDLPTKDVPCPEWGGEVRVRGISGIERSKLELRIKAAQEGKTIDVNSEIVLLAAIDADGSRLFSSADLDELNKKSAAPVGRLAAEILTLSGMTETAVDEAAENFGETRTDDSSSD